MKRWKRKKRPLGITVLGLYIIILGLLSILMALDHMEGWDLTGLGNMSAITALSPFAYGLIYSLLGISKLGVAIGVLMMKRNAWGSAFFIISVGSLFDFINGHLLAFLAGILALLYLIASKKKFRYW